MEQAKIVSNLHSNYSITTLKTKKYINVFYRRKLILALLDAFGIRLTKINLQKLVFIIAQRQLKAVYDFIPYKYGCYSYSLNADLIAMCSQGFITEDSTLFEKKDKRNYLTDLNQKDREFVNQIALLFKNQDADALMKYTYVHYPYYAINSVTAERLLNKKQMDKVTAQKTSADSIVLFTIGYEGISLEAYLNKLLINNIKVLVDVRNNPLSQKFGFSKSQLIKYCNSLNIEYRHFAELGIQSEERKELITQTDYNVLFDSYKRNTLSHTIAFQEEILTLLIKKKRIALTCFEADICKCHRKHLSEAITLLPGWKYELKHI